MSGFAERHLIEAGDGLRLTRTDLTAGTRLLQDWLSTVTQTFANAGFERPTTLRESHALAPVIHEVQGLLTTSADSWTLQWTQRGPAQRLALSFDDKVMFLVFGKFNAGKSSLCNLLGERFAAYSRPVQYFHVEAGQLVLVDEPFQEGATETTARLQGVCLGEGVVLLDTPGLHSVTPDNATLTKRFTDSADAVLWLTSSTSPGQVQELDELALELHRHKPLLPVITRSDVIDEDEHDGEIIKRLRNKTETNRRLQEEDVALRARAKLALMDVAAEVLRTPVSVSAHTARLGEMTEQALSESGFERLCEAVMQLVTPALAYKRRKPVEVLLHHLEEDVLGAIERSVQPTLARLIADVTREYERLEKLQVRLTSQVWRQVAPEVPQMLSRYEREQEDVLLCRALENLLHEMVVREVAAWLPEYDPFVAEARGGLVIPETHGHAGGSIEHLHDAMLKSLLDELVKRVDAVFRQCDLALDEIAGWASNLQESLARQTGELLRIKQQLRA